MSAPGSHGLWPLRAILGPLVTPANKALRLLAGVTIIALLLAGAADDALAQTRYVKDELRIMLRTGAGNDFRILDSLVTGNAVELLEIQGDWARVRTRAGDEGWVPTQYLQDEPVAAQQLARVTDQLEQVRAQNQQLRQQLENTQRQLEEARNSVATLTGQRQRLSQQVEQAQEGLNLAEENKNLKKQVIDLRRRIEELSNETQRLTDRNRQDWFMVGAGVLFAGMLVGIVMTRVRWRRRSGWSDL